MKLQLGKGQTHVAPTPLIEAVARKALKMADHGYVLAMGRNVLDDSGEALLTNEEVGRLYLGG